MTWSEAFAAHVQRRGITFLRAAYELNVSPSTVHYWSRGACPRDPERRKKVARWSKGDVPADLAARAA